MCFFLGTRGVKFEWNSLMTDFSRGVFFFFYWVFHTHLDGQFVLFKNPAMINESMELLRDEDGTTNPMVQYRDMDVILSLKPGAKLSMYKGFAVYCAKYNVSLFFHLFISFSSHTVCAQDLEMKRHNDRLHRSTSCKFIFVCPLECKEKNQNGFPPRGKRISNLLSFLRQTKLVIPSGLPIDRAA